MSLVRIQANYSADHSEKQGVAKGGTVTAQEATNRMLCYQLASLIGLFKAFCKGPPVSKCFSWVASSWTCDSTDVSGEVCLKTERTQQFKRCAYALETFDTFENSSRTSANVTP